MSAQTDLGLFEIQTSTKSGGDYKQYYVPDGTGSFHEIDLDVEAHVAVPDGAYGVEITALSKPFEMTFKDPRTGVPTTSMKMRAELTIIKSPIAGWEGHRTSVLLPAQDATPGNTLGKILTAITGKGIDGTPINVLHTLVGGKFGLTMSFDQGNPNPNTPGQNYPDRNKYSWKSIVPFDQVVSRSAPSAPPPRTPASYAPVKPEMEDVPFD